MLHSLHYTMDVFFVSLSSVRDPQVRAILEKLGKIYLLHICVKYLDVFLLREVYTPSEAQQVQEQFQVACMSMRSNVLALVDAWDLPDFVIKAPIGRYDGNIYEPYFEAVVRSRKARDFHGSSAKAHYWAESIRPLTHGTHRTKL
jgi:acyl-CoA oxidase